jgi:hypothetical protein
MAGIFEREPIFGYDRPWDNKTKLPEKFNFLELPGRLKSMWTSDLSGWSFFYQKTLPDFIQAATKLN